MFLARALKNIPHVSRDDKHLGIHFKTQPVGDISKNTRIQEYKNTHDVVDVVVCTSGSTFGRGDCFIKAYKFNISPWSLVIVVLPKNCI